MRLRALLVVPLLSALFACEKEPPKLEQTKPAASAPPPAASTPPSTPAPPAKTMLAVDDTGASIGSDRVDFAMPDIKGRLGLALSGKPVAGEELTLDAARDTKVPKVASLFEALTTAKVKSVRVRTPKRDRAMAEIVFPLGAKREACTAVGFLGKDGSISTWPVRGTVATRFAHGMAGPDLTLGAPGVRKLVNACESPVWAVSGDDNVTWGLVVDLVLAVEHPEDAGAPLGKDVVLLTSKPTPGRKVDAD
jgi:hypothetical protein